jgi:hypothetical protein
LAVSSVVGSQQDRFHNGLRCSAPAVFALRKIDELSDGQGVEADVSLKEVVA